MLSAARLKPLEPLQRLRGVLLRADSLGFAYRSDWPGDTWTTRINLAQVAAWTLLAVCTLPFEGFFAYDHAYTYELANRVAETLRPAPYGPFISGTQALTPGGGLYDLYALPFLFTRDPRAGTVWIVLLSGFGMWLFDRSLLRLNFSAPLRLAAVTLWTWSAFHFRWSDAMWNVNAFYFTVPVMLYATARLSQPEGKLRWAVVFGLAAAVSAQIHAGGLIAPLVCGCLLLLKEPRAVSWRRGALAVGVFALMYVPYFVAEAGNGYLNAAMLREARHPEWIAQVPNPLQTLRAAFMYASHLYLIEQMSHPFEGPFQHVAIALSGWFAVALAGLGALTRFRFKVIPFAVLLGLPVYFRIALRPYIDHYVASLHPFLVLLAAAGAGWLIAHRPVLRYAMLAYLAVYAVLGAFPLRAQAWLRPGDPWQGWTYQEMLRRTREALSRAPVPVLGYDQGMFVESVIARRVLGRELTFNVRGHPCTMELGLAMYEPPLRRQPGVALLPLGSNSFLVCHR